jgi:hypothetical protein
MTHADDIETIRNHNPHTSVTTAVEALCRIVLDHAVALTRVSDLAQPIDAIAARDVEILGLRGALAVARAAHADAIDRLAGEGARLSDLLATATSACQQNAGALDRARNDAAVLRANMAGVRADRARITAERDEARASLDRVLRESAEVRDRLAARVAELEAPPPLDVYPPRTYAGLIAETAPSDEEILAAYDTASRSARADDPGIAGVRAVADLVRARLAPAPVLTAVALGRAISAAHEDAVARWAGADPKAREAATMTLIAGNDVMRHLGAVHVAAPAPEADDLRDRIRTIADEAFGPFPTASADEALTAIERGIAKMRQTAPAALTAVRLTGAMRSWAASGGCWRELEGTGPASPYAATESAARGILARLGPMTLPSRVDLGPVSVQPGHLAEPACPPQSVLLIRGGVEYVMDAHDACALGATLTAVGRRVLGLDAPVTLPTGARTEWTASDEDGEDGCQFRSVGPFTLRVTNGGHWRESIRGNIGKQSMADENGRSAATARANADAWSAATLAAMARDEGQATGASVTSPTPVEGAAACHDDGCGWSGSMADLEIAVGGVTHCPRCYSTAIEERPSAAPPVTPVQGEPVTWAARLPGGELLCHDDTVVTYESREMVEMTASAFRTGGVPVPLYTSPPAPVAHVPVQAMRDALALAGRVTIPPPNLEAGIEDRAIYMRLRGVADAADRAVPVAPSVVTGDPSPNAWRTEYLHHPDPRIEAAVSEGMVDDLARDATARAWAHHVVAEFAQLIQPEPLDFIAARTILAYLADAPTEWAVLDASGNVRGYFDSKEVADRQSPPPGQGRVEYTVIPIYVRRLGGGSR